MSLAVTLPPFLSDDSRVPHSPQQTVLPSVHVFVCVCASTLSRFSLFLLAIPFVVVVVGSVVIVGAESRVPVSVIVFHASIH